MALENKTGTGEALLRFTQPLNRLKINTTGTVGISFDDGDTYMSVTEGSYDWNIGVIKQLRLNGSGTWEVLSPIGTFSTYMESVEFTEDLISGMTGWWRADDIDGSDNSTLTDGDFIDTWVDKSTNGRDLLISGGERPIYRDLTLDGLEFDVTGSDEHRIGSFPTNDFEDFLPSDGKSVYMCVEFLDTPTTWTLGTGRNLVSDGGLTSSQWGLEYARYTSSGSDYNIVFHQGGSAVDSTYTKVEVYR